VVLKLGAIGITNGTWRNSPLEDWHAEGRIHDGGMLRTNVTRVLPDGRRLRQLAGQDLDHLDRTLCGRPLAPRSEAWTATMDDEPDLWMLA
jgi:hypothetical protein